MKRIEEYIDKTEKFLEDEVTCPYCGEVDKYATDDGWCYQDEAELENECSYCEKKFMLYPRMSWAFTSRAIESEVTDEMIDEVLGGAE